MSVERSFLLIKPDGYLDGGVERARQALREQGLEVTEERRVSLTPEAVSLLYPHRVGGDFWKELCDYLTPRPSLLLFVQGEGALEKVREVKGKTGQSGLRQEFAQNFIHNTFHAPDDPESCAKEMSIFRSLLSHDDKG